MLSEIIAWRFLITVFREEMINGLLSSEYCIFGTKFYIFFMIIKIELKVCHFFLSRSGY